MPLSQKVIDKFKADLKKKTGEEISDEKIKAIEETFTALADLVIDQAIDDLKRKKQFKK